MPDMQTAAYPSKLVITCVQDVSWWRYQMEETFSALLALCAGKSPVTVSHPSKLVITCVQDVSWWRYQMETFYALLAICAGNSPVTGEYPTQRPVTRSFDVFLDLCLNKRLSKQSWDWWFETPSCPLWRHCNVVFLFAVRLFGFTMCSITT